MDPASPAHVSVYVTCPDAATAQRIARRLIDLRLIACANVFPVTSIYRWQGEVHEGAEVVMFLKSRRILFPQIEAAIRAEHPDEVPCIVAFPLVDGHSAYLTWIDGETVDLSPPRA